MSAFPPMINSVLTPSTALVTALPGPLVAVSALPFFGVQAVLAPVQVGGLSFSDERPRAGDRVAVTFRVNLRTGAAGSVCRIVVATCAEMAGAIVGREGNVITVRVTVTATSRSRSAGPRGQRRAAGPRGADHVRRRARADRAGLRHRRRGTQPGRAARNRQRPARPT